jgi:hypothetical protein
MATSETKAQELHKSEILMKCGERKLHKFQQQLSATQTSPPVTPSNLNRARKSNTRMRNQYIEIGIAKPKFLMKPN